MKKVIHAVLVHKNELMETFLDVHPDLKVGCILSLSGEPDVLWEVMSLGEPMDLPLSAQTRSERFYEKDLRHQVKKNTGKP